MIDLSKVPHLQELKELIDLLHDDAKYYSITQCFHTMKEAATMYNSFRRKIKEYYDDINELQGKKTLLNILNVKSRNLIKLLERNDYFLFDNFEVTPIFYENVEAMKILIYSPFSINFFSRSLKNIFNQYFTGKKPIPKEIESINEIVSLMCRNFLENMKFCPAFLKYIFTNRFQNDKKKTEPTELFEDLVIEKIFEDPYIFNILDFNEQLVAEKEELDRLKNSIKGQFKIEGLFIEKPLDVLPNDLKPPPKPRESSLSPVIMINFRDFLRNCNSIPDQISSEISDKPFLKQLKSVLVDQGNHYQDNFIEKLENQFSRNQKIESFLLEGLKIIKFQIKLNELSNLINDTLFFVKCFLITYQNPKFQNYNYENYINDTMLFFNDITKEFMKQSKGSNDDDDDDDENIKDQLLYKSTIGADKSNPYFLNVVMLKRMTLKKFIEKRPELRFADQSFDTKIEAYKECEKYQFEPLMELKNKYQSKFIRMANTFSSSFSNDKDPYNMMRCISKAYTFALNEMKLFMYPEENISKVYLEKEEEEKFIISLFLTVRPSNIFSTYIYFYEFLLSPRYKKGIFDSQTNNHFDNVEKIYQVFMSIFNLSDSDVFNIAEYCRICQKSVNLVLKNKKEVLHKLANIISMGDSNLKEMYKKAFNIFSEKSVLKNSQNQFTFRVYSIDEKYEDPLIWICNVTDLNDSSFDNIPLDSKENLVKFLIEKTEKKKNLKK